MYSANNCLPYLSDFSNHESCFVMTSSVSIWIWRDEWTFCLCAYWVHLDTSDFTREDFCDWNNASYTVLCQWIESLLEKVTIVKFREVGKIVLCFYFFSLVKCCFLRRQNEDFKVALWINQLVPESAWQIYLKFSRVVCTWNSKVRKLVKISLKISDAQRGDLVKCLVSCASPSEVSLTFVNYLCWSWKPLHIFLWTSQHY